ncbi:VOC family protein [Smaragdicoccus niigatensis]|uniref:VOC family protein n=1 Tax=Smaragdicoccus niigatensis TaxID=359359 RepID=UPI00036FC10D|nr:VOC family protein [Smaragdicoccus niigatensis]
MDWKIELVALPVTDVDRAKNFYTSIGFNADHDHTPTPDIRFVQLTPPGSACSIAIGTGLTQAQPGSVEGLQIVVASADEAYAQLVAAGAEASPVVDMDWGRFTFFADPDGNKWAVQELPKWR